MYLSRELTDSSLPKIGKEFGGRDHTTVIHANAKITRLIREDRSVYNLVQELTARIKQAVDESARTSSARGSAPGGPVDNSHLRDPQPESRMSAGFRSVIPVVHTPYDYDERFKREMMETDIAIGSGIRRRRRSRATSQAVSASSSRAVSSRGAVQVLGGVLLRAADGRLELEATDMELSLRTTVAGDGRGRRRGRRPGEAPRRHRAAAARERGHDRASPRGRGRLDRVGLVLRADERLRRGGLPAAARRSTCRLHEIDAASLLDTVAARVPRRVARRVAAGAHRDPRPLRGRRSSSMAATDSYRLAVKETELAAAGPELEAIIPARALHELGRVAAGAESVQLGVHENHVIFGAGDAWLTTRRIDGQFPNYAQLLPETFEVELELSRARSSSTSCAAPRVMAQRNTPLRLRFAEGELTISAQTQDVGEARESLADRLRGRTARDRVQRGVPARRPRVGDRGRRPAEAHQPAAARADQRRGRRLLVPDHADPARRLSRRRERPR